MKATSLIGKKLAHTTDTQITGKITDVVFDASLKNAEFYLADVTTDAGTAPLLFSPSVLTLDADLMLTSAHPDDIAARMKAAVGRMSVPIDPADLPTTLIGPFGNTMSPSLLAALFNARNGTPRPQLPSGDDEADGIWFTTELEGHAVRAHVGNIGTVADVILDENLTTCENVVVVTAEGHDKLLPPSAIKARRGADDSILMSLTQPDMV